jgi:asparagine synthase (glutamine-hydrolysing)
VCGIAGAIAGEGGAAALAARFLEGGVGARGAGLPGHDAAARAAAEAGALSALGRAMAARLAHRGPDGEGVLAGEAPLGPGGARRGFVLAHRRLVVIDPSPAAAEPLASEDGETLLVMNGEVYNHRALRERLVALGHRFRSRCDAEAIVHLHEERGPACVEDLRGMYAFAALDRRRGALTLARDPAGKKPLYYAVLQDGALVFASEVAALVEADGVERALDRAAIEDYLALGYVPAPRTGLAGVRKLLPGEALRYEGGRLAPAGRAPWPGRGRAGAAAPPAGRSLYPHATITAGSNINRTQTSILAGSGLPEFSQPRFQQGTPAQRVRRAVIAAVRARLESDVPLGAFLSGGVDSTITTALTARLLRAAGAPPLSTFSIGFAEPRFDESGAARLAAAAIGTLHHERMLGPEAALEAIPSTALAHGEPFADSSAIPTWHLARLARERVTVALSGDGGDEHFLGYRHQRALRALRWLDALAPASLRGLLARAAPPGGADRTWRRQAGRLLAALGLPEAERYLAWCGTFPERGAGVAARLRREGPLAFDRGVYLPDDILAKVDRATMAHGLEARAPLLDAGVVAAALALPPRAHAPVPWRGKAVLLAAFRDVLPAEVARRPKAGFGVPVSAWLRGALGGPAREVLLSARARGRGIVDPTLAARLLEAHARGEERGRELYALLMLEMWLRAVVDPPRAALPSW